MSSRSGTTFTAGWVQIILNSINKITENDIVHHSSHYTGWSAVVPWVSTETAAAAAAPGLCSGLSVLNSALSFMRSYSLILAKALSKWITVLPAGAERKVRKKREGERWTNRMWKHPKIQQSFTQQSKPDCDKLTVVSLCKHVPVFSPRSSLAKGSRLEEVESRLSLSVVFSLSAAFFTTEPDFIVTFFSDASWKQYAKWVCVIQRKTECGLLQ